MNPLQLLSMLSSAGDPKALLGKLVQQQFGNTPMAQNMMSLINKGDKEGLEQLARNLCQSRGMDYDKEFTAFVRGLGM